MVHIRSEVEHEGRGRIVPHFVRRANLLNATPAHNVGLETRASLSHLAHLMLKDQLRSIRTAVMLQRSSSPTCAAQGCQLPWHTGRRR